MEMETPADTLAEGFADWGGEETDALSRGVQRHGVGFWEAIKARLPGEATGFSRSRRRVTRARRFETRDPPPPPPDH